MESRIARVREKSQKSFEQIEHLHNKTKLFPSPIKIAFQTPEKQHHIKLMSDQIDIRKIKQQSSQSKQNLIHRSNETLQIMSNDANSSMQIYEENYDFYQNGKKSDIYAKGSFSALFQNENTQFQQPPFSSNKKANQRNFNETLPHVQVKYQSMSHKKEHHFRFKGVQETDQQLQQTQFLFKKAARDLSLQKYYSSNTQQKNTFNGKIPQKRDKEMDETPNKKYLVNQFVKTVVERDFDSVKSQKQSDFQFHNIYMNISSKTSHLQKNSQPHSQSTQKSNSFIIGEIRDITHKDETHRNQNQLFNGVMSKGKSVSSFGESKNGSFESTQKIFASQNNQQVQPYESKVTSMIEFYAGGKNPKQENKTTLMAGKCNYPLPNIEKIKFLPNEIASRKMHEAGKNLLSNDLATQGVMYVIQEQKKIKKREDSVQDALKEYVKNFGTTVEANSKECKGQNLLLKMTQNLHQKSQHAKKDFKSQLDQYQHAESAEDKHKLKELLNAQQIEDAKAIFSQAYREEENIIQNIGQNLLKRVEYQMLFKKPKLDRGSMERDFQGQNKNFMQLDQTQNDPKVQYFLACKKSIDTVLPILEKVWKKTLCLQDYTLTKGHSEGIAIACQYFDPKIINRVLFANCGMSGVQFAEILKGLAKLDDVKSITYKQNVLNLEAVQALDPIFKKRLPRNLEEFKMIDVKASSAIIEEMINRMSTGTQIRKLALVNCDISEKSFEALLNYVKTSVYLYDLDLSWCLVRHQTFIKIFPLLKENRHLRILKLAWNRILFKQSQILTQEDVSKGVKDVPLTPENMEIMDCFKQFIKYNPRLIEIDLSNCLLNNASIFFLAYCLRRSQSLRVLHLCGNLAKPRYKLSDNDREQEEDNPMQEGIKRITERLHAKIPAFRSVQIRPYNQFHLSHSDNKDPDAARVKKLEALKFQAKQKMALNMKRGQIRARDTLIEKMALKEAEQEAWKHVRQGLRLRDIVLSTRINDTGLDFHSAEKKKLVIQRQLGVKELIPGSAQWQVITKQKDECWICSQQIFTFFLWSKRFGQIDTVDQEKANYYIQEIKKSEIDDMFPPIYEIPHVGGAFNDWHWQPMRSVIDFCKKYDKNPPNFIQMLIEAKQIRLVCGPPQNQQLSESEKEILEKYIKKYYSDRWPSQLMRMIPWKKPMIAYCDSLEKLSEQFQDDEFYFYCTFLKPGRHTYVIRQSSLGNEGPNEPIIKQKNTEKTAGRMQRQYKEAKQKEFYVYEQLASFRPEDIPEFYKERNMVYGVKETFRAKNLFKDWAYDKEEIAKSCFKVDAKLIRFQQICLNDEMDVKKTFIFMDNNYQAIKEVFEYLQSKSPVYPYVDNFTLFKFFIRPSQIFEFGKINQADLDIILSKTRFDTREDTYVKKNWLNRFQFSEAIIHIAKQMFTQFKATTDRTAANERRFSTMVKGNLIADETFTESLDSVHVHQAVRLLLELVIDRWKETTFDLPDENFRREQLWTQPVELVFTMNELALKELYNMLCKSNQDTQFKPYGFNSVTPEDCDDFFRKKLKLKIHKRNLLQCYVQSKQAVIADHDEKEQLQYRKMVYIEFLEFLSRLAMYLFKDTESEDIDLANKIEFLLDDILPEVSAKRKDNTLYISEFSESDEDY